jgi:hypothetical protein
LSASRWRELHPVLSFFFELSPSAAMEWIALFIIAPLVLIPMVVLWGYAGCGFSITLPAGPSVPANLTVTATTPNSVSLSWTHDRGEDEEDAVMFEIERRKDGETTPVTNASMGTDFTDVGLLYATLYHYKVRAVSGVLTSDFTPEVDATTQPPAPCFSAALTTNQTGLHGYCIVQRIEPARLAAGGSRVFITIRGSTQGNLVIDRVFISRLGASGNPYDSGGDNKIVASEVQVPANTSVQLSMVAYDLDRTRPLLVSFDINGTAGNGNVRYVTAVPAAEAVMYFRPATAEAAIEDRSPPVGNPGVPPYTVSNSIYLIETIEVA